MDLDEQLAALAAGELDDATARALRARAATDPAIARRLARHRQLQRMLEGWEAPAMSDEAVARLEARVDEALSALEDGPLADERAGQPVIAALPDRPDGDEAVAAAAAGRADGDGQVVDLDARRRRRGLPSWVPAAAVAAALAAVVGTGIVVSGLPGGVQEDMVAEEGAGDEPAQAEAADDAAADDAAVTGAERRGGPARRSGVVVAEGELLALVETEMATTSESNALQGGGGDTTADTAAEGDGEAAEESDPAPLPDRCVTEALERDTAQAADREVWLVADGTYAGNEAVFVVIRTPATPEDRHEVLAYDPADCRLLARDETTR